MNICSASRIGKSASGSGCIPMIPAMAPKDFSTIPANLACASRASQNLAISNCASVGK